MKLAIVLAAAAYAVSLSPAFAQIKVGAHLVTAHAPQDDGGPKLNDTNPGLYVVFDTETVKGVTLGFYENSFSTPERRRWTFYGGKTWDSPSERYALTVGLATGYQHKHLFGQQYCRPGYISVPGNQCRWSHGHSSAKLRLLVAPSIALHEARQYIGVVPRLSMVGVKGGKPNVHLSVERRF